MVSQQHLVSDHADDVSYRWHRDAQSLGDLDDGQLLALYQNSPESVSILGLAGDPVGVGVGLRLGAGSFLDRFLRQRSTSPWFPWLGKSFRIQHDDEGWGFNRIASAGLVGAFRFDVDLGTSYVDGRPTITFDYGLASNPRLIRRMHDEIREVGRGVFLGIARIHGLRASHDLAWFALDVNDQRGGIEI
jgi:hypothetical protein